MHLPDLHIQTSYSDGLEPVESFVKVAKWKGINEIGVADHYSIWHKMNTTEKFLRYLLELQNYPVYVGVEIDIGHELPVLPNMKKNLDFVLAGLHRLHGKRLFFLDSVSLESPKKFVKEILEIMVIAMEKRYFDVLAHPTQLPPGLKGQNKTLFTEEWIEELISSAADQNIAIELNCGMKIPDEDFIRKCIHKGIKIATGSSAHKSDDVGELDYAKRILRKLEVEEDQIFLPKKISKKLDYTAIITEADLIGQKLNLKINSDSKTDIKDLELAIFYDKEGRVGKRIIVPSQKYREIVSNQFIFEYVPEKVEIRLYYESEVLDKVLLLK
jgi:putative hydrolase